MKILYVTTIGKTMRFFQSMIHELLVAGYCVELAANEVNSPVPACYQEWGCAFHHVDFSRAPLSPDNLRAYGQLKAIIDNGNYDIVHCHTPNASVITRLVCRKLRKKTGLKVFYTAHGFHFYKGAPMLNWLVYYPVEKLCSWFTDRLITINQEDYALAKSRFHAGEVHYVPGVGIDLSKFENAQVDRAVKRREIGVPEEAKLMISVGELSERKNHRVAIKALALMNNPGIHYVIVGRGTLAQKLQDFADSYQIGNQVHLLGYRNDIAELYKASDVCCFPSLQEGLPVAVMEAMACGLPVVCSNIRGNVDLIDEEGGAIFDPSGAEDCADAMIRVLSGDMICMGQTNKSRVADYSISKIIHTMKSIYES